MQKFMYKIKLFYIVRIVRSTITKSKPVKTIIVSLIIEIVHIISVYKIKQGKDLKK